MDVAAIGGEVEDRIADDLAGPVIGDVAAASGLDDVESPRPERLRRQEEVLHSRVAPEREDRIVLEEKEGVGDAAGLPLRDEARLQVEPLRVRHAPEVTHLQRPHRARRRPQSADSSNSWRPFLRCAMNLSASAPSTMRWSKLRAK